MLETGVCEEMIMYASRFDFPNKAGLSNTVTVERVYEANRSYYWTIKLGNSRWSRKFQRFVMRGEKERTQIFINDTTYTLDEAYKIASTRDLYTEHLEKMNPIQKSANLHM